MVPDTCVLLHFQRLDKIPWPLVIGAQPVRLVIPLLVLDELDDKRYLGSATIKEKARSAVKPLDEMQEQLDADGYATLPDGSTVEYLLDDPHHHRQANPDEEIVDRAAFLANVTKHPVIVLTGDRGMRVRVTARRDEGLRALVMPAQYSRDQDEVREASDGK